MRDKSAVDIENIDSVNLMSQLFYAQSVRHATENRIACVKSQKQLLPKNNVQTSDLFMMNSTDWTSRFVNTTHNLTSKPNCISLAFAEQKSD